LFDKNSTTGAGEKKILGKPEVFEFIQERHIDLVGVGFKRAKNFFFQHRVIKNLVVWRKRAE